MHLRTGLPKGSIVVRYSDDFAPNFYRIPWGTPL